MHIDILEYIKKPQKERQTHLVLSEPCTEIGGNSTTFAGILAFFLKTTIPFRLPKGKQVDLCHACGNCKCANPKHLYWGTRKENVADAVKHGTQRTIYEKTLAKHGPEKTKQFQIQAGQGKIKSLLYATSINGRARDS